MFFVCVLGAVGLSALPTSAAPPKRVWVDGRALRLTRKASLYRVLLRADVAPVDGVLRSAVTGAVLDPHADPAEIRIDGVLTPLSGRVRPGQHVEVYDGRDRVESTFLRIDPLAPNPPLPDVERDLWAPGADGTVVDEVGEHSGEVAPKVTLVPSRPAGRVPGNVISLTFDDGPDPKYTPKILDILQKAGIKATFCMVGTQARAYPDLVKTVHDAGHTICDNRKSVV